MTLPTKFRKTRERILANYDAVDLVAGTGIVSFWPGRTQQGYRMSNKKFYSNTVSTAAIGHTNASSTVYTKLHDVDFDLDFNQSQTIKGKTIISIPFGIKQNQGAVTSASFVNIIVKKVEGGSETELATASGGTITEGTQTNTEILMSTFEVDIGLTTFKRSDVLRLTVEQYERGTSGDVDVYFGHDPKERPTSPQETVTFGSEPSIAEFQVPFRINP